MRVSNPSWEGREEEREGEVHESMMEQGESTRAATIQWSSVRTVRRLSLLWRSGCGSE